MNEKMIKKVKKKRGSATIEAIISFTGFLFVIFTILNVVNFCRVQMLISNAVDTAAKEISQYSYFYKMSGLQKLSSKVGENAEIGSENINGVLSCVDGLYTSVGTAVDNSVENVTNVKNAVESGKVPTDEITNALKQVQDDGSNIESSIQYVTNTISTVQDDPLLYMRSIVAIAGNTGLDLMKSHVLAAPLGKMFTAKHFGKNSSEADKYLERLGVVDGLDGMNFKMSTVFASKTPNDIHLVVYYKMKIVQPFKWATLEAPFCKEARAVAWLGGDAAGDHVKEPDLTTVNVPATPDEAEKPDDPASPDEAAKSEEGEEKGEENKGEEEGKEEDKEEGEEEGKEEKKEEESKPSVDTTDSYWHLPGEKEGEFDKDIAFYEQVKEDYDLVPDETGFLFYTGKDTKGNAYSMRFATERDSAGYVGALAAALDQVVRMEKEKSFKENEITQTIYVLYVPENISDEEFSKIQEDLDYAEYWVNQSENIRQGSKITISGVVRKAGGNYDYGKGD